MFHVHNRIVRHHRSIELSVEWVTPFVMFVKFRNSHLQGSQLQWLTAVLRNFPQSSQEMSDRTKDRKPPLIPHMYTQTRTRTKNIWQKFSNFIRHIDLYGRDIVVGIVSRNGLDGLGIESQECEIFCAHPDRACCALGMGSFRGGVNRPGPGADHPPRLLSQGCWCAGAVSLPPFCACTSRS